MVELDSAIFVPKRVVLTPSGIVSPRLVQTHFSANGRRAGAAGGIVSLVQDKSDAPSPITVRFEPARLPIRPACR